MVEVVGRSVETILEEWRAVERQLDAAPESERAFLEARVATLREEHRTAVAARSVEAEELRGGLVSAS
jgi:hypothetical protein